MQKPSTSKIDLNLVSPVQQTVEQAKSEIHRSKVLKRKHPQINSHSPSKRRRKQASKKRSQKASKSKRPNKASTKKTSKSNSKRKSTKKINKLNNRYSQKFTAEWLQ